MCNPGCFTQGNTRNHGLDQTAMLSGKSVFSALLAACTSLPTSMSELPWQDLRGDRGNGVATRDLAACVDAAESRRSVVEHCMRARGWQHPGS